MNNNHSATSERGMKWALLLVSLVTILFLVVAALVENVFPPWRLIRMKYKDLLEKKATDERGRSISNQFEVSIQQNVLPELDTVDRCVTCHAGADDPRMANEPQPYRTHPGKYLARHPPEKFGCTVCHRGQGRALLMAEAKAEGHHWDYPLLPTTMAQSACGMCHTADEVAGQGGEKYALGKELFESKGCQTCHKIDGRGGSMGPALDNEGLKVKGQLPMAKVDGPHTLPQWLQEHFSDPQKIVAGSQMKPPQLSDEENEALTIYMLSLQGRDLPRSYLSPEKHQEYYKAAHPDPQSGENLYSQFCAGCHDTGQFGRYDKFYNKFMPAIRSATFVETASPQFIDENIRKGRPGTLMPAWESSVGGLSDEEIARIRDYLLQPLKVGQASSPAIAGYPANLSLDPASSPTLSQSPPDPSDQPTDPFVTAALQPGFEASGDINQGAMIFARHCVGCHTTKTKDNVAPALNNAVLQQAASDGFLFATIAAGRKNTAMPAFLSAEGGLTASDVESVVAFLRLLVPGQAPAARDTVQIPPAQK